MTQCTIKLGDTVTNSAAELKPSNSVIPEKKTRQTQGTTI